MKTNSLSNHLAERQMKISFYRDITDMVNDSYVCTLCQWENESQLQQEPKHNITLCPSQFVLHKLHLSHHGGGGRVYIYLLIGRYFFISPHIIQNLFKHPPLNQRKKLQPQPAVLIRKIKYRRCKAPPIVQRCIYY